MPAAIYNHPRFALERECFHDFRDMIRSNMRAHVDDWAALWVNLHTPAGIVVVSRITALGSDVVPEKLVIIRIPRFGDAVFGALVERKAKKFPVD